MKSLLEVISVLHSNLLGADGELLKIGGANRSERSRVRLCEAEMGMELGVRHGVTGALEDGSSQASVVIQEIMRIY